MLASKSETPRCLKSKGFRGRLLFLPSWAFTNIMPSLPCPAQGTVVPFRKPSQAEKQSQAIEAFVSAFLTEDDRKDLTYLKTQDLVSYRNTLSAMARFLASEVAQHIDSTLGN